MSAAYIKSMSLDRGAGLPYTTPNTRPSDDHHSNNRNNNSPQDNPFLNGDIGPGLFIYHVLD